MATFKEKSLGKFSHPMDSLHLGYGKPRQAHRFSSGKKTPHELSGQQQVTEKLQGLEFTVGRNV